MVTRWLRTGVLLALLASCASPSAVPPPEKPEPEAVGEARDWSALPDFDELRARYGEREDFAEVCEDDRPLRTAFEAADAGEWQRVLGLADPWLAQCEVDIDFHLLRAVALAELGRESESRQQLLWRDGLVKSVLRSGDGKTAETAWEVISVGEEYAILRAFGMERRSQTLTPERIDRIEAERDGEVLVLYFDPAAHFRRMDRQLGEMR